MNYLAYGLIAAIISLAFIIGMGPGDDLSQCQLNHSADYCYNEFKP